jgi:FkbH-like protein
MNDPDNRERPERALVVAGTFSIEPILQPLQFWVDSLELSLEVRPAPHDQVLQQLLNPRSLFRDNQSGINVLILRPEHCAKDLPAASSAQQCRQHIEQTVQEWIRALRQFRAQSAASLFVLLPVASQPPRQLAAADLALICEHLASALRAIPDILLLQHSDIAALYPVETCLDDATNEIADVPFTTEYFAAMATLLIRKAVSVLSPPYKVIVLDCDHTLWQGVCGEAAAQELELSTGHLAFQQMLLKQHAMGRLLCLCSRNNPADVQAVFAARPDMPLRLEHIVAHRINWEAKSSNLMSLAAELQLGLDSFIFIDDSPLECAEVRARAPEVLTLQAPADPEGFRCFLEHTWAFDITSATAESRQRSSFYRQNQLRAAALAEATDFASFLTGLNLEVIVQPLRAEQMERAAELVVRTNQFNLTTIRRLPAEIAALARQEHFHLLTVTVRDRFGEYGLTGLVFVLINGTTAEVDTFLLSCRVLGRGVEATILNHLGRWASARQLQHIQLEYKRSPRNAPALRFLTAALGQYGVRTPTGTLYKIPVQHAITLSPSQYATDPGAEDSTSATSAAQTQPTSRRWRGATQSLTRVPDIVSAMGQRSSQGSRPAGSSGEQQSETSSSPQYQQPLGVLEQSLAQLWQELLGDHRAIDRNTGFVELGADSVLVVKLTALIGKRFGVKPSLGAVMRCHSLASMAQLIAALRPIPATEQDTEVEEGSI